MPLRRPLALLLPLLLVLPFAAAQPATGQGKLPPEVEAALLRARVPLEAVSAVVHEVGSPRSLLAVNATTPMNPASVVKLLTTAAALDQLGPAWTWATPVWLQGRLQDGVLEGTLTIKGSGDPKLVMERAWLLLRRVQQLGVREIRGDIVLDSSAFNVPDVAPGDFDGEAIRAYNVKSGALLFNYKASIYSFTPDAARGIAIVSSEPPLAGQQVDRSVPLSEGACGDWASALKASFSPARVRFAGSYAAACGEQTWALADSHPASYNQRFIEGLWREMGGKLSGAVREGAAPVDAKPSFEHRSPPLIEVVREINKFSNNVMAQQLFLTLALARPGVGVANAVATPVATPDAAREAMKRWLAERLGELPADLVIDNGSGLSRETRLAANTLSKLLLTAWDSPWMPELMSSLPITGVDGTVRRSRSAVGRAHLKTGSLRDVAARAGYVLAGNGKRYVLVVMVNHANAIAARPAMDALVQWTMNLPGSGKP